HAKALEEAQRALVMLDALPTYRAPLLGLMALSRADRGDLDGAFEAASEAMRILDSVGGTLEGELLVRIAYAEGLRARGDVEGSKKAIREARDRLLERSKRIKNPEWRRQFLEKLGEHQRILMRAGEWLA
ncbi:MAG TPA: hypothetical protein VIF62_02510, partial [Labilithrix sp.]